MAVQPIETQTTISMADALDRAKKQREAIERSRKSRQVFDNALGFAAGAAPLVGAGVGAGLGALTGTPQGAAAGFAAGGGIGQGVGGLFDLVRGQSDEENRRKEQEGLSRTQMILSLLG